MGFSSDGRAVVSKTTGRRFESCNPCKKVQTRELGLFLRVSWERRSPLVFDITGIQTNWEKAQIGKFYNEVEKPHSEDAKSIMELPRFVQGNAADGGSKPAGGMQRNLNSFFIHKFQLNNFFSIPPVSGRMQRSALLVNLTIGFHLEPYHP